MKYRILILTDHVIHTKWESIYSIARELKTHPKCGHIHVASRSVPGNEAFFHSPGGNQLLATVVDDQFIFQESKAPFLRNLFPAEITDYDFVMLRLPRANSMNFFLALGSLIPEWRIINQPGGIIKTGDKSWMLKKPELCAPIRLVRTFEDIEDFARQFPIVLKPLNNSGGNGIVKVEGDRVFTGDRAFGIEEYRPILEKELTKGMLGMKFLRNVTLGDKRVIMVNGEVVAAALRLPAEGTWLCNVGLGGRSEMSEPNQEELEIAASLGPALVKEGVIIFGFDTLAEDDGRRVLSEINTSCVNGIYPADLHSGRPVVKKTAELIWKHILSY